MACLNCRTVIELMQREVDQLKARKIHLLKINGTLKEAAAKVQQKHSYNWKLKYQEEVQNYKRMETQFFGGEEPYASFKTGKVESQRQRSKSSSLKSVEQMDRLMSELKKSWMGRRGSSVTQRNNEFEGIQLRLR